MAPESDEGIDIIMLPKEIIEKYNTKQDTVQKDTMHSKNLPREGRMRMKEGGNNKMPNQGGQSSGNRQRRPGN
jgi:hypothetical protein